MMHLTWLNKIIIVIGCLECVVPFLAKLIYTLDAAYNGLHGDVDIP